LPWVILKPSLLPPSILLLSATRAGSLSAQSVPVFPSSFPGHLELQRCLFWEPLLLRTTFRQADPLRADPSYIPVAVYAADSGISLFSNV